MPSVPQPAALLPMFHVKQHLVKKSRDSFLSLSPGGLHVDSASSYRPAVDKPVDNLGDKT